MTRRAKIAQIPNAIREQLNIRLEDGEQAAPLAEWLNSLPEVETLIANRFDGFAVTQQNISDWSRGGFRNWQLQQKALNMVQRAEPEDSAVKPNSRVAFPSFLA